MKRTDLVPIDELAAYWREEAASLSFWPHTEQAVKALENAAKQLDAALAAYGEDILTLSEAARESGFSQDHLARLVRETPELNAGRRHAPRIRRRDLPPRGDRQRRTSSQTTQRAKEGILGEILRSKLHERDE